MKRKNLLNENQVRKFMKLANIKEDLTDNFLTEDLDEAEAINEEDEMEDAEALGDMPGDEGPMDDAPLDDMGEDMGDEMGDEPGISLSEPDALALVDAIVDAIGAETGIEFETSMGGDEEAPMDADADLDFDAAPEDDLDADVEVMDEDEIVNETLRRVTHRLNATNERNKIVNEAMRRIQTRFGRR